MLTRGITSREARQNFSNFQTSVFLKKNRGLEFQSFWLVSIIRYLRFETLILRTKARILKRWARRGLGLTILYPFNHNSCRIQAEFELKRVFDLYLHAKKKSPHTQKTGKGSPLRQALTSAKINATRWQRIAKTRNAMTTPVQSKSIHTSLKMKTKLA